MKVQIGVIIDKEGDVDEVGHAEVVIIEAKKKRRRKEQNRKFCIT